MNYATSGWDYVVGGYGAAAVLLGGYTAYLRGRARSLGRQVPARSDAAVPPVTVAAPPESGGPEAGTARP